MWSCLLPAPETVKHSRPAVAANTTTTVSATGLGSSVPQREFSDRSGDVQRHASRTGLDCKSERDLILLGPGQSRAIDRA